MEYVFCSGKSLLVLVLFVLSGKVYYYTYLHLFYFVVKAFHLTK